MSKDIKVESAHRDAIKNELINNHDAAPITRVLADPDITLEEMRSLTADEKAKFRSAIGAQKSVIGEAIHTSLEALLVEAEKNTDTSTKTTPSEGDSPSQEITIASARATAAMEAKLGKMGDKDAKNFLGAWQRVWSKVPGTEPTDMEDIGQAINQSRAFNEKLIAALMTEYNQNTTILPVGWFSNMPGWFPALQKNHNFGTTPYNGKLGVEGKRAYIQDTMNALAIKWEQADTSTPEWVVDTVEKVADWALPLFGYPALLLFFGKVGYNMMHDGIRKPGIGEAAGWSVDKTWQGTKKVATFGKSTITTGYNSVNGKFATQVEKKDLKDTPAYDADGWKKERARLEETTRRMIYMDSGVNPRHNPNATSAEIFRDVENTPALKAAYDARMVKLTELGNTLVGQDKYLSQEAFNKEAGKIVAGDIGEKSIKSTVLKRVPFTADRKEYKETQAALKKVKGEIDTMRARLSAKSMMDGVEIPKVLEAELQALENAHKAAYEADLILDKSRNAINRTKDSIIDINEAIAHFEEINKLQDKIDDPVNGIKKQMVDIQTRIDTQRSAAHSENLAEQRQREAEGKQGEIDVASREREQAIKESDAHDLAKREALKDKRNAEHAVQTEEARIRKDLADREQFLRDEIARYPAKIAAGKNVAEKTALGNEKTALEDELNGKKGKVKDLTEQLVPPHTGSSLAAKKQAVQDAIDAHNDLIAKDAAVQRKVTDAELKIGRLASEKTAILTRSTGPDAKSLTASDEAKLKELSTKKGEIETKIKEAKTKIDALAKKQPTSSSSSFPRSTGGTLALAQAELARLNGLIAPGGTLDTAKTTAKVARDAAFTHLNTTIVTLNTESARLNSALEIKIPYINELIKGQGYSEGLGMRENGITGEKAVDHKLKGSRPSVVKTVLTRGH